MSFHISAAVFNFCSIYKPLLFCSIYIFLSFFDACVLSDEKMGCVHVCSASHFKRAVVMPNLKPPVTTTAAAITYRESIMKALPIGSSFDPLMTLYLTDKTHPDEIKLASKYLSHCFFIIFRYILVVFLRQFSLCIM